MPSRKSNLSESHILENQGQERNSQDSQEKAWNSYSASYKSVLCSHSTSRPKEAKYKFPAVDPPAVDGLLKYSPKELYIYLINLIYHRLSPDTYKLWCELTERDVCFPEISKNGVLESSYSLKHQRDQFKKTRKKTEIAAESNLLMSKVEDPKIIPDDILKKLQDNKMYLSMYLLKREEYITFLNELLAINFSPAFTKLVKRMLRLASIKQNDNCRKFRAMNKKLLRIHNNYSLH